MNKKNEAAKQIMLYVILLGILAFALVYLLGYRKYNQKAETLKTENADLKIKVEELKKYYDAEPEYKQGIAHMEEEIENILAPFPGLVLSENALMVASDCLDKAEELEFKNINANEEECVLTINSETVLGAKMEQYTTPIVFVNDGVVYQMDTNYQGLKDCVDLINGLKDRNTIRKISFVKLEEQNVLEGTIEVDFYYVVGANKEYEPLVIPDYKEGLEDLFNLKTDEELEEEKKNEEKKD